MKHPSPDLFFHPYKAFKTDYEKKNIYYQIPFLFIFQDSKNLIMVVADIQKKRNRHSKNMQKYIMIIVIVIHSIVLYTAFRG